MRYGLWIGVGFLLCAGCASPADATVAMSSGEDCEAPLATLIRTCDDLRDLPFHPKDVPLEPFESDGQRNVYLFPCEDADGVVIGTLTEHLEDLSWFKLPEDASHVRVSILAQGRVTLGMYAYVYGSVTGVARTTPVPTQASLLRNAPVSGHMAPGRGVTLEFVHDELAKDVLIDFFTDRSSPISVRIGSSDEL